MASGMGKHLMDSIRSVIAAMEAKKNKRCSASVSPVTTGANGCPSWLLLLATSWPVPYLQEAITVIYKENRRRKLAEHIAIMDRHKLDLILTSLGDGVVAADIHGNFSLFNPMAEKLLGLGATQGPREDWAERYGVFFEPDWGTPYPPDQLPLARTIRGEQCENVEMFIRNPNRADGVMMSATGKAVARQAGDIARRRDSVQRHQRAEAAMRLRSRERTTSWRTRTSSFHRTRLQQLQTKRPTAVARESRTAHTPHRRVSVR